MSADDDINPGRTLIWRMLSTPTALSVLSVLLYQYTNFLVFHTITEFFSILVGFTALTVSATSSQFTKNQFVVFLAIALGWCSILDFIHVLVYQGMNLLPGQTITESTQFWIAGRFLQAIAFLFAPLFLYQRYSFFKIHLMFFSYTMMVSAFIFTGHFPITYAAQSGVTEFKYFSELIIIVLLCTAIFLFNKYRGMMATNLFYAIMASMLTTIFSELFFASYLSLFGIENLIGHILKIYAYWFIYIALVVTTLREPFNLLNRAASSYDAIPEPTVIMNAAGIIYQANEAAGQFTQSQPESLVGLSSHILFHNSNVSFDECPICHALQNQHDGFMMEIARDHNSWVECKLSPIESPYYKEAWIQVIRDVTVRKQLERAKNIAIHDLGERIKELRCLNAISALSTQDELTIPTFLQKTAHALPEAFQYPDQTTAKIESKWGTFIAGNLPNQPSAHLEQAVIYQGETIATINVFYSEIPDVPHPLFLKEEQMLLDTAGTLLSSIINRLLTAKKNEQNSYLYEMLSAITHAALRCHNDDELLAGLFEAMQKYGHFERIIIAKSYSNASQLKIVHSMDVHTEDYNQINEQINDFFNTLDEHQYAELLTGEMIVPSTCLNWGEHKAPTHENAREFLIPLLNDKQLSGLIYIKGHVYQVSRNEVEGLLNEVAADASFALTRFEALKSRIVAEKKAEQSEYRFIEIFMAAPIPMMIVTKETLFVQRMNNAFIKWTGYSEQDVAKSKDWLKQFLKDAFILLNPLKISATSNQHLEKIHLKEITVLNKKGVPLTVLLSSLSLGREIILSFSDITNIRLQENEIRQKEENLRQIIEQPNVGIYVRDENTFLYTNNKFCDIIGYSPDELKNKGLADLITKDPETQAAVKEIWHSINQKGNTISYQIPFERKDGQHIILGIHGTLIIRDGKPAFVSVVEDITKAEHARQQTQFYIQKLENAIKGTFLAVSNMVELRDPYTSGHEHRVAAIAKRIAQEMGLSDARCNAIELIGLVHDIGKVSVPAELLAKPGRLSQMEFELVKGHAEAGYKILKDIKFDFPVAETIWQHHERLDGSGYPRGLKGDEILLETRIVMVADVAEAMSAHRPYRASLGLDAALEELQRGRDKIYDPIVVDALLKLVRENNHQLPV